LLSIGPSASDGPPCGKEFADRLCLASRSWSMWNRPVNRGRD
jgi:hypothetical protein